MKQPRFNALLSLLLLPFLAGTSLGAEPPTLIVTPSGYWLMEFDDAGIPRAPVKVTSILVRGTVSTPTPVPDPPVDNPPVIPTPVVTDPEIVAAAKAATQRIGLYQDAQAMAIVYSFMGDFLKADKLKSSQLFGQAGAVVVGTEIVLTAQGTADRWTPWRKEIGDLTKTLTAAGKLDSQDEHYVYLKSVAQGLRDAVPFAEPRFAPEKGAMVAEKCAEVVDAIVGRDEAGGGP